MYILQGLMQVFDELMHGVEHHFCLRHLYNNYNNRFGGSIVIRNLMMAVAKTTYYQGWEANMEELKKVNQEVVEWLYAIPRKSWCKHAFSAYSWCNVLMNNLL